MRKIFAVVGPTGVGKTGVGFKVAFKYGYSIVSCDARQVYRYMDIGTAKPDKEMRRKVPHYMIDIVDPDQRYTAYEYARDARRVIEGLDTPIIIGGSGLYLKALVDGLSPMPKISLEIREELSRRDTNDLYGELLRVDSKIAEKLHPNDKVRVIRALEVYKETGIPISEWRRDRDRSGFKVDYICVHIDRERLYRRIEERVDSMIARGLVDEVKSLLKRYGETAPALASIGYSEIIKHLKGEITFRDAVHLIKKNTRAYSRRQLTWFRHTNGIRWMQPENVIDEFKRAQKM